jgi:alkanesulfonate monooxygenase SsuD/methylene tetrahydromethanopterin reductase-like flavin-dependent oxidoreductase (luciferase family)
MDDLGYTTFWMAEHHFQREGTECIPNVLMMALHLTHLTKNLAIGCGFNITPMWHPLRLAEDYAMADILSNGRVVFGVGRGYHTREVETFGSPLIDQEANRELFEEQVEIIFKAFNNDSFAHKGKHYTLPPEVPYRGYTLKDLTLVPRPARLPVECWQPIQGGSERALAFMARHGIQGMVGGGSAEGGAMHNVVLKWQAEHAKIGKHIDLGERLCFGFHFYIGESKAQCIREAAKYYEENMKMFGELRLNRALSEEQIEIMRDPRRAPTAKLPRIEDAVKSGGFLTGSAAEIIEHLKQLEKAYPGLDRISISPSLGVPKSVILEQLERFAKEVMPAFKHTMPAKQPALAK